MERMTERYEENGVRLKDADKYAPFVADALAYHRLAAIEDILGDEYDLDELREMVQAKREGRCVVLPCKVGDTVYQLDYMTHSEALKSGVPQSDDPWQKRKYGRKRAAYLPLIVREKKMVKTLYNEFGKTVFLTREEAQAALRREQK